MTDINDIWIKVESLADETMSKAVADTSAQLYKEIVDRTPVGRPELWKFKPNAAYKPGDLRRAWEIDYGKGFKKATASFAGKNQSIVDASSYRLGSTITIRNLTEYAEIIEYGNHSKQAPEGMVRISLLKFNQFLKTAVKNNKV